MQTAYTQEHVAGTAGDLANSDIHSIRAMRNNTASDLPYGIMVASDKAGTGGGNAGSDQAVRLLALAADSIVGITVNSRAHAVGPTDALGSTGTRTNDMVDVLTKGVMYIAPEQDVAVTDPVFYRVGPGSAVDGSNDQTGTFRKDIDAITAWIKKTVYGSLNVRRCTATGYVYKLSTIGTSEDSDAGALLAATPTTVGTIVTDGTCAWTYLGRCDSSTRASAVALTTAAFRVSGTAASLLAAVEINLP